MKESKLFRSLLAIVIVVALGAPTFASTGAKSDPQGVSVKVSFADLNLQKQEGASTHPTPSIRPPNHQSPSP